MLVVVLVVVLVVAVVVVVAFKAGLVAGGAVSGRTRDGPLVLVGPGAGDVVAVVAGPTVSCSRTGRVAVPTEAVGADSSPLTAAVRSLAVWAPWVTTWRAAG